MQNIIVNTNWLYKNLGNKNLIIFDSSWHMPNTKRDAFKEFKQGHILESQYFDIDKISNKKTYLPHMTPSSDYFQKAMRSSGLNNTSIVVVYDTIGIYSSARVWWLFKYFGHKEVYVLNGGLKKWIKENKPITKKIIKPKIGNFKVKKNCFLKVNYKIILKNLYKKNFIILDARNSGRFNGRIKEPRQNLKSGHIPKSKNLFWGDLITNNGTMKRKENLKKILKKYKLKNKNIVTSCGSGITACILSLGLLYSNNYSSSVYDGSWSEWGSIKKLPVEK